MKCPKCKATIDDNSKFCDYCGKEISNSPTPIKKVEITEEEYHKYYMGENYYAFKNKFNIPAFIFGGLYIFYRKQYVLGTIFILISVLTMVITPAIAIILHLLLGIAFNNQYVKFVNKKTHDIKIKNINKSKEEILKKCNEKGGTSLLSSTFAVVLVLFLIIIILNIGGTDIKVGKGKTLVKVSDNNINSMIYEVPEEFKSGNYNTNSYRSYTYNKDNNYCRIIIETYKKTGKYSSVENFLNYTIFKTETDKITETENITINKQLWRRTVVSNSIKTSTYYATEDSNYYYLVYYIQYNNNAFCNQEYNKFMNSLNFRD